MMRKVILSLAFIFPIITNAEIFLPAIYSDGMVLQQQSTVTLWGWADPGDTLRITSSWMKDTVLVRADAKSKWEAGIKTPKAGGPYHITVLSGSDLKVINDVQIGEVWLCSGQSNMEWGAHNHHQEMIDALPHSHNPNIRVFHVPKIGSDFPQEDMKGNWAESNPESLQSFSAIGYFIAKKFENQLNVPIGVINASWGGTAAETWLPKEVIESDNLLSGYAEQNQPFAYRPHESGSCWNSMIYPLTDYKIAGAFWYQGESNVGTWQGYAKLFQTLITTWRKKWQDDFPFYFVQIAPFEYKSPNGNMAAFLREQQEKALDLPKTGMVVTTDLVDDILDIHPTQKREVADRLSNMVLAEVYDKPQEDYKSPVFDRFELNDDRVMIYFKYLSNGLTIKGEDIKEMYVTGSDGNDYPANVTIRDNVLEVYSKEVKRPVSIKFGFSDTAQPNLFNRNGLPVSPFRIEIGESREIL